MKQAKNAAVCGLFSALIAVGAFIKITIPVPIPPFVVTFSMQWFFVLLAGLLIGSKRAGASVCTYLIIGLLGVPIFAHGGGPAYLLRPTFGFLIGFALAAYVMGLVCELIHPVRMRGMMVAAVIGLVIYYLAGVLYFYPISNFLLGNEVGWKILIIDYVLSTIGLDFILCVLAAAAAVRLKPALRFLNQN
jgi:biotin transport system substrate-specific component